MGDREQCDGTSFPVSVCLKEFFSDERALCYVSVSGERRVSWLQRRLRRLFSLPAAFCLQVDDHLLPPDERLALLRPLDRVTAKRTLNKECYEDSEEERPAVARLANGVDADESLALRDAKRRALALADLDAEGGPPARRARRRVRRRKARAGPDDDGPPPAAPRPPPDHSPSTHSVDDRPGPGQHTPTK